jgi:hypothetical protein
MLAALNNKLESEVGENTFLTLFTDVYIFYSRTTKVNDQVCFTRGYMLTISATKPSLNKASAFAYKAA